MRSFTDIDNQINLYVDEIRTLISQKEKADGKRLQWKSDAQKKKEIWESGVLSISDSVCYANKKEIEILLGVTPNQFRCCRPLSTEYYLWVPGLSVRDNSGKIYSSNNWENYLSEDKNEIVEMSKKGSMIIFSSHRMEHVELFCKKICIIMANITEDYSDEYVIGMEKQANRLGYHTFTFSMPLHRPVMGRIRSSLVTITISEMASQS